MQISKVSVLLLTTSLIINAAIAIVGPFFPPEAEKKGIDTHMVGYIFSIYPFSFVIVSLIAPKMLNWWSRKAVFIVGSIIYAISVIGFGLIIHMEKNQFYIWALLLRWSQGGSNAAVYTTTYSVFAMQYEGTDMMRINSYFKSTLGIGMIIGLGLGTLLLMAGGYMVPFVVFGIFFLVYMPFVVDMFPSEIAPIDGTLSEPVLPRSDAENNKIDNYIPKNSSVHRDFETKSSFEKQKQEKISQKNLNVNQSENIRNSDFKFKNSSQYRSSSITSNRTVTQAILTQPIMKCLILAIVFISILNFAPPILSSRLSELHFHKYTYGLVFAIPCLIPVFSLILANILMHKCNGNAVLIIGTVIISLGFYILISESKVYLIMGISLLGFAAPFAILPLFPMMTNSIDRNETNVEAIKNTLSGLYNASLGVGAIIGPVISANLTFYFDFYTTVYWLGNASLLLSIILFLFGGWCRTPEKIDDIENTFDIDIPDYSAMTFVKKTAFQVPKKSVWESVHDMREIVSTVHDEKDFELESWNPESIK